MIRKTAGGYTVFARTGRRMGTYRSLARAQERLGQLETFKANRAPLGRMSPTVRSQSKDGKKGYYVRAKSGRSMGWYATKREAEMRMGQLKAQGAKHFTETRGYTRQGSPILKEKIKRALAYVHATERSSTNPGGYKRSDAAAHAIAAENLNDVEASILLTGVAISEREAKEILAHARRLSAVGHSWPGQPKRHAKAARLGNLRHARRYSHSPSGAPTQAAANRLTRAFSRAELIAALGLEPEGHTRGQKYNFTTDEFRRKVAFSAVQAAVEARHRLGIG